MATEDVTKEIPFRPSTIENIDTAMFRWLEGLNLSTTTNQGWKRVQIQFGAPERAFAAKNNPLIFDANATLVYPLIILRRTTINKDPNFKGSAWGNVPRDAMGGCINIARIIKSDKTDNFAHVANRRRKGNDTVQHLRLHFPHKAAPVVYETITMDMPVYVKVGYEIAIKTEYILQMNDLLTPFLTKSDQSNYFTISNDNHRYEAFIRGEPATKDNFDEPGKEPREIEARVNIDILGYIQGEGKNSETPKWVRRENAVEFKESREQFMVGDKGGWTHWKFFRE